MVPISYIGLKKRKIKNHKKLSKKKLVRFLKEKKIQMNNESICKTE